MVRLKMLDFQKTRAGEWNLETGDDMFWTMSLCRRRRLFYCNYGNDVTFAARHFRPLCSLESEMVVGHCWINPDNNYNGAWPRTTNRPTTEYMVSSIDIY